MKKTTMSAMRMMTLAMMTVMTMAANAMGYSQAKKEALFLSDKMAYELNLTDLQYEYVYEINLDYLLSVNGKDDVLGIWWDRRNADLHYVLTAYQYNRYVNVPYFYRPIAWAGRVWTFHVYSHYTNKSHFYRNHPKVYASYRGGNNRKAPTHYAERKPAPRAKESSSTWRVTASNSRPAAAKPVGHNNRQTAQNTTSTGHNNRQTAQNTTGGRHYSGRR